MKNLPSILLAGLILFIIAKRIYYSRNPAPDPGDANNVARQAVFKDLPIDSTDIVFVGTSRTEYLPLELLHDPRIHNRGIGSNRSSHVLGRIGQIAAGHPSKLFIELGINDLMCKIDPDTLFDNYRKIVDSVRMLSRRTSLFIQSIMPVNERYNLNGVIEAFNIRMREFCKMERIDFITIPIPSPLPDSLTIDGVHLNLKGDKIWMSALPPI